MRFLVVQHDPDKGLGLLEQPLRYAGVELDVRMAGRDPVELDGHAAVVALPGLANPEDGTVAVDETRETLRQALRRGVPALGICLGAELLAEAAGGRVRPCPPEYGYFRVAVEPSAALDPLLGGLPAEVEAFQAHSFAVELPPKAVVLARSESAVQAFRVGERAWGIQFHPEPTFEMLEGWLRTIEPVMRRNGVDPAGTAERAREQVPLWAERAARIAGAFAEVAR